MPEVTNTRTELTALGLLALLLFALLGLPLARGNVLYPRSSDAVAGGAPEARSGIELWYQDVVQLYVPETAAHLDPAHDSWLATWNPRNELGRPLFQTGAGPAFVLARAVAWFTRDPFVHYSWMAALSVAATAFAAYAFLRALAFRPLPAWVGAAGISVGPLFPTWAMLPLVQWDYAGAFGSLAFFERWRAGKGRWNLVGLAFCIHAILLAGYQQHALGLGWICAGWVVLRTARPRAGARRLGAIALTVAVALASVAPVYVDLWSDWRVSQRAATEVHWDEVIQLLDPMRALLAGEEIGPASYGIGPLYAALALIGAAFSRRRQRHYWSACSLAVLLASCTAFGSDAFRALGMSFSIWSPIFLLHLPVAVLAAGGTETVVRLPHAAALGGRPVRALLVLAVLASIAGRPRRLTTWSPRSAVQTDSPVASELRRRTADGSRYAVLGPRPRGETWLPSNVETVLGLYSLHSYDHVLSRAFHDWVKDLGPASDTSGFGRRFASLSRSAVVRESWVAFSGLSTLVSFAPLPPHLVAAPVRVGDVWIGALNKPGVRQALLPWDPASDQGAAGADIAWYDVRAGAFDGGVDTGCHDLLEFRFAPSDRPRLLFLSQQYHPRWTASAGSQRLRTLPLNGLFQGVVVPPATTSVELRFLPFARWIWLGQAAFATLFAVWSARALGSFSSRRRARPRSRGGPPPA